MPIVRYTHAMHACRAIVVASALLLASACSSSQDDTSGGPGGTSNTTGGPGAGASGGPGTPGQGTPAGDLAALQRHKAEMLTSIWENSTTVLQYGFSRNNNDGYGYTSGRAGFTTATSDSYFVVKCFDPKQPGSGNLMKKYEQALAALSKSQQQSGSIQPDTSTLDAIGDYNGDWHKTAADPAMAPDFDACQDEVVGQLYYQPTLAIMKDWGLTTGLAMALIYDSTIVHGEQGAKDLASQANSDTGNGAQKTAAASMSVDAESKWLGAFLVHRVALIAGDDAWKGAIDRAANYEKLRRAANWDLAAPIVTDAKTNALFSGGPYIDGRYPVCTIAPNGGVTGDPECTATIAN